MRYSEKIVGDALIYYFITILPSNVTYHTRIFKIYLVFGIEFRIRITNFIQFYSIKKNKQKQKGGTEMVSKHFHLASPEINFLLHFAFS